MNWQQYSYGELLNALRKDLQLDASTDLLPGTIAAALGNRSGVSLPKFAFGTGTLTFTASATSAAATVTHGLGTTPTNVQVTIASNPVSQPFDIRLGTPNAATFVVVSNTNVAVTATLTFYWLALA